MRHITISQSSIDDPRRGLEYRLYLDSDNECFFRSNDIAEVLNIAEDYLTTKEYKDDFMSRINIKFKENIT